MTTLQQQLFLALQQRDVRAATSMLMRATGKSGDRGRGSEAGEGGDAVQLDPNFVGAGGETPLVLAVRLESSEVVSALLHAGADPNQATAAGDMPLIEVCACVPA